MRLSTHRRLGDLRAAAGTEYGKLVQKLLAAAFLEAGATRLVDRAVQGVDLEVTLPGGRRLALEVKTTEGDQVKFGKKDLEGLEGRRGEGFEPHVAVLGPHLLDEWVIVPLVEGEVAVGADVPVLSLRAWRDPALSTLVARPFEEAVASHAATAQRGGQQALNAVLRRYPAYVPA